VFTPRVTAGVTWTDNVRASSSNEESEFIVVLEPGFHLSSESARTQLDLDYSAQGLWYADNSDLNDVFHNLYGTGLFTLVPNHFFLDAFARYDQVHIDPGGRLTSGNLIRTGNRSDAAVYGLSPWYQTRFGRWAEATARYRYQAVNYTNTDPTSFRVRDSDTHSVSAQLGSLRGRPGLSWLTSASYSWTDYDQAGEFEYGRAALDLGYPVGPRTRLTGTFGVESDVANDPAAGGFDAEFWYLGVQWEPTALQSVEARVGNRFYGTAYDFSWARRGARGDLSVSYSENPTTPNQSLFTGDGAFSGGRPGTPWLDAGVYLSKRLNGRLTYRLARTELSALVYAERRERLDDDPLLLRDDRVAGVQLGADWAVAPRTVFNLSTRYEQRDARADDRSSDLIELSASLRRDLTAQMYAEARAGHAQRNLATRDDYQVNAVSIYVGMTF
jgi:hypothetical protein